MIKSSYNYDIKGTNVSMFFNCSKFPAGENHIYIKEGDYKRLPNTDMFFVEYSLDLMSIGMKVDILRRAGSKNISIVFPYLPYGRQDRYTVEGESFSLKVFANFLNSLNLDYIYTIDCHSDVSGIINNLIELPIQDILSDIVGYINFPTTPSILSPDAGAVKKVNKFAEYSRCDNIDIICASKVRNLSSGKITSTIVPNITNSKVLIIDDICDGGRTFIEISKKINSHIEKYLYVTHGIFSKPDVFDFFKEVFTTNTFAHQNTDKNLTKIILTYSKVTR